MHRFFITNDLIQGNQVIFPADLSHQITRVLRLRQQERVVVLDNRGLEYEVELQTLSKRSVRGMICQTRSVQTEPQLYLTLYMALLKGKKLDWVLQKGTELGVCRFVPILTRRCVVPSLKQVKRSKISRWQEIVREAAEQSQRGHLPEVRMPHTFENAISEAKQSNGISLIAWEMRGGASLKKILNMASEPQRRAVNLFIGPEGGFEEQEIRLAKQQGVLPVTLGPRILRAETAALAAVTAILYEFGEWEQAEEGEE